MAQSTFPYIAPGSIHSSQPPINTSSVLLDGQIVNSPTVSGSITGNGGSAVLFTNAPSASFSNNSNFTANGVYGATTFTINSATSSGVYYVQPNTPLVTSTFSGTASVTISPTLVLQSGWNPVTNLSGLQALNPVLNAVTFGTTGAGLNIPTFVAVGSGSRGLISYNATTWSGITLPTNGPWNKITYGVVSGTPYFVAGGITSLAYSTDGVNWTNLGTTSLGSSSINSIGFANVPSGNSTVQTWVYGTTGTTTSTSIYYTIGSPANTISAVTTVSGGPISALTYVPNGVPSPGGGRSVGGGAWLAVNSTTGQYTSVYGTDNWTASGTNTYPTNSTTTLGVANGILVATFSGTTTSPYSYTSSWASRGLGYTYNTFFAYGMVGTTPTTMFVGSGSSNSALNSWWSTNLIALQSYVPSPYPSPVNAAFNGVTYGTVSGMPYFVAITPVSGYPVAYITATIVPTTFGIYNSPTTEH